MPDVCIWRPYSAFIGDGGEIGVTVVTPTNDACNIGVFSEKPRSVRICNLNLSMNVVFAVFIQLNIDECFPFCYTVGWSNEEDKVVIVKETWESATMPCHRHGETCRTLEHEASTIARFPNTNHFGIIAQSVILTDPLSGVIRERHNPRRTTIILQ